MRLMRTWGLAACVVAGGTLSAAEPAATKDEAKPSWFTRMVSGSPKPSDKEKTFAEAALRPKPMVGPYEAGVLADALKAEQDAWDRRLEVCRKLREQAGESEGLLRQVDELEKRATNLYHQRVARLGVKGPLRASAEEPSVRFPRSDRLPSAAPIPSPAGDRTFQVVNP